MSKNLKLLGSVRESKRGVMCSKVVESIVAVFRPAQTRLQPGPLNVPVADGPGARMCASPAVPE